MGGHLGKFSITTSIDKKGVICYFDICSTAKMVKLR